MARVEAIWPLTRKHLGLWNEGAASEFLIVNTPLCLESIEVARIRAMADVIFQCSSDGFWYDDQHRVGET